VAALALAASEVDAAFIKELILEEGTRLHVYDDATGSAVVPGYTLVGHPSIGVGRALDLHGISGHEAQFLLDDDLAEINAVLRAYPWWIQLSSVRQFVICDLAFNVGITGLLAFVHMIAALKASDYDRAATEMLASSWATELPTRSHRLAQIMRTGELPV
jgi:lysozyme